MECMYSLIIDSVVWQYSVVLFHNGRIRLMEQVLHYINYAMKRGRHWRGHPAENTIFIKGWKGIVMDDL